MIFLLKLMLFIILLPIFLVTSWISLAIVVTIIQCFVDGVKEFNIEIKKKKDE